MTVDASSGSYSRNLKATKETFYGRLEGRASISNHFGDDQVTSSTEDPGYLNYISGINLFL